MNRPPLVLIIRDGWGYAPPGEGNAIGNAGTPHSDYYESHYPTCYINTSGESVGLPGGTQGNSEVGHLNIGAGRVVFQSLTRIDESIKSTLQAELIHFRDYSAYQLIDILEERARTGARKTPKILIRKIAALTAKNTNSDVRVAIKTLYYCLLEDKISIEDNFGRARKDILMDVITNLNDKNLQILRAIAVAPDKYVKRVYETYRKISAENREEPYSYVYFYSNLAYLQSLNLLLLISTKIHKTYTNRIQLLFDPNVLEEIWQMRFD